MDSFDESMRCCLSHPILSFSHLHSSRQLLIGDLRVFASHVALEDNTVSLVILNRCHVEGVESKDCIFEPLNHLEIDHTG